MITFSVGLAPALVILSESVNDSKEKVLYTFKLSRHLFASLLLPRQIVDVLTLLGKDMYLEKAPLLPLAIFANWESNLPRLSNLGSWLERDRNDNFVVGCLICHFWVFFV